MIKYKISLYSNQKSISYYHNTGNEVKVLPPQC